MQYSKKAYMLGEKDFFKSIQISFLKVRKVIKESKQLPVERKVGADVCKSGMSCDPRRSLK